MITDELGTLATTLMRDVFGTPATLIREAGDYDPRTDRRSTHEHGVACLAVLAPRRTAALNGVVTVETVATLTAAPKAGDRLKVGGREYTVGSVEEIAPTGKPIIWKAVLR